MEGRRRRSFTDIPQHREPFKAGAGVDRRVPGSTIIAISTWICHTRRRSYAKRPAQCSSPPRGWASPLLSRPSPALRFRASERRPLRGDGSAGPMIDLAKLDAQDAS